MIETILQALMYPFLFLSMYFQVLLLISFFENKEKIKNEEHHLLTHFPTVTVAVPCWNEAKTIGGTIESLLSLEYPKDKVHIVIVDNNSTDNTQEIVAKYQAAYPQQITIMKEEKQGKHNAVNAALASSTSDLFGCLDADSYVAPRTLKTIVSYFDADSSVMAVTPCIHIRHPKTFIQRMQAIEYLMGVFLRKSFGQLDAIQVTPGPFSIFRKDVFGVIGAYRKAHNTEDYEITLRMHKAHLKIVNSHKALVYTVGPATAAGFFYQRLRWARGFLENSLDYKELFFKKEYGNFGMFTLPLSFAFVFYGLYAAFFSLYSVLSQLKITMSRFLTVGIHLSMPKFDLFYFNTTVMSFVIMVMFSMFLFVLYIGNSLSDDRQQFYRNFPVFFVLYPLFVPVFLCRAVIDTFAKRKNEWVLQDTKTLS
jgi:cellulose synthase/poly-beta-1,6-N-acetylglucosamine synthase-like glycosyltransferase